MEKKTVTNNIFYFTDDKDYELTISTKSSHSPGEGGLYFIYPYFVSFHTMIVVFRANPIIQNFKRFY